MHPEHRVDKDKNQQDEHKVANVVQRGKECEHNVTQPDPVPQQLKYTNDAEGTQHRKPVSCAVAQDHLEDRDKDNKGIKHVEAVFDVPADVEADELENELDPKDYCEHHIANEQEIGERVWLIVVLERQQNKVDYDRDDDPPLKRLGLDEVIHPLLEFVLGDRGWRDRLDALEARCGVD